MIMNDSYLSWKENNGAIIPRHVGVENVFIVIIIGTLKHMNREDFH